jgi:uncharacterized lipoprotein YddW (UPF0748 family)
MSIAGLMTFLMLSISATDTNRMIIDSFEYKQISTAQDAWKPQAGSLPVELTEHDKKQALLMRCDFSKKQDRCYWDKQVNLDLSRFGRFSFWIYAENPASIQGGSLYFQSGDGWFASGFSIGKNKWHKVSVRKSSFRIEGSPKGWNSVNNIRIAFWKANDTDTTVAIDSFETISDKIVIVMGDNTIRKNPSQARSIQDSADLVAKTLEGAGLEFGVIADTDVESGVLSDAKLAIFPYNPDISDLEFDAIAKFVESGGKIMAFYMLPAKLADLLGIESTEWSRETYAGQFNSIKFEPDSVDGIPDSVNQGSWNVTIPKPRNNEARIIGRWADTNGKVSETPAMTLNKNGMFMGHVLLSSDLINKGQMILAVIGELLPDMRESISETVLRGKEKIAGLDDMSEVNSLIEENVTKIPDVRRKEVTKHLSESEKLSKKAEKARKGKHYGEVLKISRKANQEFQEAFLLSFPSKKDEFRALWCHSAFGIPGWDWDKAIENVKKHGFNAIVPNMLWGGLAYYSSDVLPVAEDVKTQGDQIAKCLEACRKHGVQMHVWKVNWNLANAPQEFVEKMRNEGKLQRDRQGNELKWLCPSNSENYKLELESMLEIVKKYDVDGIHFDYIRYPDSNACFCQNCKEEFEKSVGVKVENWPDDVFSSAYADKFIKWRSDQITRLVRDVSEQARKINPKVKISAAVFNDYPACIRNVGQDWKLWIDSGYLDFVCPMDYTDDNDRFTNMVTNQKAVVNGLVPLYPGIGASAPGLSPDQVAMQAHVARTLGVDGFIIFNYDLTVATSVLPALFKGLTSE